MKKIILAFFCLVLISNLVMADKPEKITFIHYKDGNIKPVSPGKPTTTTCYKLLGVKWLSVPVSYVINPTNSDELSKSFITNAISASTEEWDKYTSRELFNDLYTIDYTANWDDAVPDYRNEYSFGLYPQSNVIAVTIIWGYFSGPKSSRRIIEYDVLFNTYYPWGDATLDPLVMDLQNIATHETGHGVGLSDLYNTCVQETMYGYSSEGETSKRDLNTGDIQGLQKIYGV